MIRIIVAIAGPVLLGAGIGWLWHPGAGLAAVGAVLILDALLTELIEVWERRR